MSYHSTVADIPNGNIAIGAADPKPPFHVLRGIKNASYLALGNLISQAVSLVGFTCIARMLGPDDYGIYVTVGAFVGMFDVLLLGGLSKVIIRQGSQDISSMRRSLEKTIAIRNVLIPLAIVVCAISCLFTPYAFHTKLYIVLFSLQLVYNGLNGFLGTIYQASEKMQYIAILNVANRTMCVCVSVVCLYCGCGLLALFLTLLGSNLVTLLATYWKSRDIVPFRFFSKMQFDKSLIKPAIVFSLVGFIGVFTSRIDLLMISFLSVAKSVGVYGVAYKIAQQGEMPRNVCAVAFFPILVKRFHGGTVKAATLFKYSLIFCAGILVLSIAASFFAEGMISVLFGPQYRESGRILRVLIFYLAFSWATLPLTSTLQATHNERHLIVPTLTMGGLNIGLNYLLFMRYGIIGIAYSTLAVQSVGCVVYCIVAFTILKRQRYLV